MIDAEINVRVLLDDGSIVGPLPLRDDGVSDGGVRAWTALCAGHLAWRIRGWSLDRYPAHATVDIEFLPRQDGDPRSYGAGW